MYSSLRLNIGHLAAKSLPPVITGSIMVRSLSRVVRNLSKCEERRYILLIAPSADLNWSAASSSSVLHPPEQPVRTSAINAIITFSQPLSDIAYEVLPLLLSHVLRLCYSTTLPRPAWTAGILEVRDPVIAFTGDDANVRNRSIPAN